MNYFTHQHILKNFIFLCLGQYGGMACNLFFSIMLTRLLTPDDYGLFAIILFYFIFFNWIVEWGWEQGFMAHKEVDLQDAACTHLTIRLLLGVVPLLTFSAMYFGSCHAFVIDHVSLFIVLSLAYWGEKIGLTYRTILERSYRLHTLAGIEFCTVVVSYLAAVLAALHGAGVWSLVIQRCIEKGFITVIYYGASPWKYGGHVRGDIAALFFKSFGMATWLGGIVSLTIYDFMPFLVGKMCSTYEAGLYAKAFSMATFPVMLTGIFNRLTVPLYTQYQGDVEKIRSIFVKAQTIKFFLLVPLQMVMASTAYAWIPRLIGNSWLPMIPVYQVMTAYGIVRAFFDDVPAVMLYGFKHPWELTKNQLLQSAIIIVTAPWLVAAYGAWGGACAMVVMLSVAAFFFWKRVCLFLSCSMHDFMSCIAMLPQYGRISIEMLRARWLSRQDSPHEEH